MVAGCFTAPVNMRPTVQITPKQTQVFRGQTATYTAVPGDPDGDAVTLVWAVTAGDCPANYKSPEAWPATWQSGPALEVGTPLTRSTYCVWAKVTDRYGATDVSTRPENPANHAPVVSLELADVKPPRRPNDTYQLRTRFMMSGANTTDADEGDPRKFTFEVRPPQGSNARMEECPEHPDPALSCFTADIVGDYVVKLRFSDSLDGTEEFVAVSQPLQVSLGADPVAKVTIVSPMMALSTIPGQSPAMGNVPRFPLGSDFKFSAADSVDLEPVDPAGPNFMWDHSFPADSAAMFLPCADDMSQTFKCFTADVPGRYWVSVKLVDGPRSSTDKVEFEVMPDAMPCLGDTHPDRTAKTVSANLEKGKDFLVDGVDDDLDPFPFRTSFRNAARFDWFVAGATGKFTLVQTGAPNTFHLAGDAFRLGDVARVRVQIRDRDNQRSQLEFDKCGDADTCPPTGSTCIQRFTWNVDWDL
jgi:hypothetical protein